jgi:hypothetical protein
MMVSTCTVQEHDRFPLIGQRLSLFDMDSAATD